jgi:antitoxin (DNA-binding transcriptional repressor) of toxin-antitoxin stability system
MPIEEASGRLMEIISGLHPGEEITLTSKNQPVATIIPKKRRHHRQRGTCKGMLTILQEDDAHLADFKEYM